MEGLRLVSIDAKRVTHPLFVIVKPRKRDSDRDGNFVAKAADLIADTWRFGGVPFVELYDEPDHTEKDWWSFDHPLVLLHRYLRSRQVKAIPVAMCGEAAWALSASMLAHFSIARKVSGPTRACDAMALSASTTGPLQRPPLRLAPDTVGRPAFGDARRLFR